MALNLAGITAFPATAVGLTSGAGATLQIVLPTGRNVLVTIRCAAALAWTLQTTGTDGGAVSADAFPFVAGEQSRPIKRRSAGGVTALYVGTANLGGNVYVLLEDGT